MNIAIDQVIVWLVVCALAGLLTGMLVTRRKRGFGALTNLAVGLAGALLGGFLFRLLKLDLGLGSVAVSLEDLVPAVCGSLVLILLLRWLGARRP